MDWELIFWAVLGLISLGVLLCAFLPINWDFQRKNDPYRYCPKEEE